MGRIIPRGQNQSGGEHIEIEYAPPFAGLDSSALDPFIQPNAITKASIGFLEVDNQYTAISISKARTINNVLANIGVGDLDGAVFSVGQVGTTITVYAYSSNPFNALGLANPIVMGTFTTIAASGGQLSYININQVCYFSFSGSDTIYQHNGTTATILTNYLGGAYLAELNGRLIVGDVWQTVGITTTHFPYQFAWSAPGGAYNQFNPLVGGLVTGAGFNNLPDVEDEITGIITQGPTAYVLRRSGITEVSPLNSGIQPFDFNHLWASHKGIGGVLPQTISQYGSFGVFIAEDDIYTIGYSGINAITGKARTEIFSLIQPNAYAIVTPIQLDGNVDLYYLIVNQAANIANFLMYSFTKKEWFRFNSGLSNNNPLSVTLASLTGNIFGQITLPEFGVVINRAGSTDFCVMLTLSAIPDDGVLNSSTITFQAEECAFGRDVTIDGILLYVYTNAILDLSLSVNGVPYGSNGTDIITVASAPGTFTLYQAFPFTLPFTGTYPQLTLTITASTGGEQFKIAKISMFGTVNPAQRPI